MWVGDVTYLPHQSSGWLDRYSRTIMHVNVRDTMPLDVVSEALRRTLAVRRPLAGLVVHSIRGN